MKLHLGCGTIILEGFINSDIRDMHGASFVDVEKPLPYPKESVDEVIISHLLCLVKDRRGFLEEIYRVLKPKGLFEAVINPTRFYTDEAPEPPNMPRKELYKMLKEVGFKEITEIDNKVDKDLIKAQGDHKDNLVLIMIK